MFRVGFPGWKVAARLRVPVYFRVKVHKDAASGTYWAESDDLDGLAVAGDTLDELHKNVIEVAGALMASQFPLAPAAVRADLSFQTALTCPA